MSTTPETENKGPHAVRDRDELAAARLQLLAAARYKLAIHLPSLPADAFNTPAELAELRRIATSGRNAEVRIVLGDADAALRAGHRLIELAQRLPSAIQIRIPASEDDGGPVNTASWLLNDTYGYLFLPDASRWKAGRHWKMARDRRRCCSISNRSGSGLRLPASCSRWVCKPPAEQA